MNLLAGFLFLTFVSGVLCLVSLSVVADGLENPGNNKTLSTAVKATVTTFILFVVFGFLAAIRMK